MTLAKKKGLYFEKILVHQEYRKVYYTWYITKILCGIYNVGVDFNTSKKIFYE